MLEGSALHFHPQYILHFWCLLCFCCKKEVPVGNFKSIVIPLSIKISPPSTFPTDPPPPAGSSVFSSKKFSNTLKSLKEPLLLPPQNNAMLKPCVLTMYIWSFFFHFPFIFVKVVHFEKQQICIIHIHCECLSELINIQNCKFILPNFISINSSISIFSNRKNSPYTSYLVIEFVDVGHIILAIAIFSPVITLNL